MYVVSVEFRVDSEHVDGFREAMHRQAENSLDLEPGCRYFDVAEDPHDPTLFLLYELYQDEAAFRQHLDSEHFQNFSETVSPWVKSKLTKTLVRTWPPEGH